MEKVVGYVRVSTPKQTKGHSIEYQKEAIKKYCKAYNLELVKIYKDEGLSAYKDRPDYERMLKRVYEENIQGIIVNDLTRFGRSTSDLLMQIKDLDSKGKKLISIKDNIDISTKNGRLMLGMLSLIADYEKETILERMEAGREIAKKEGTKFGRPKVNIDWELVKMLRPDVSWTQIAKKVNVSCPTIIKRAKEKGID